MSLSFLRPLFVVVGFLCSIVLVQIKADEGIYLAYSRKSFNRVALKKLVGKNSNRVAERVSWSKNQIWRRAVRTVIGIKCRKDDAYVTAFLASDKGHFLSAGHNNEVLKLGLRKRTPCWILRYFVGAKGRVVSRVEKLVLSLSQHEGSLLNRDLLTGKIEKIKVVPKSFLTIALSAPNQKIGDQYMLLGLPTTLGRFKEGPYVKQGGSSLQEISVSVELRQCQLLSKLKTGEQKQKYFKSNYRKFAPKSKYSQFLDMVAILKGVFCPFKKKYKRLMDKAVLTKADKLFLYPKNSVKYDDFSFRQDRPRVFAFSFGTKVAWKRDKTSGFLVTNNDGISGLSGGPVVHLKSGKIVAYYVAGPKYGQFVYGSYAISRFVYPTSSKSVGSGIKSKIAPSLRK